MAKTQKDKAVGEIADKILLLVVAGMSQETIAEIAKAELGIQPARVADLVADARRRLTIAADYSRDEQLGLAITRLNDCYGKSAAVQDWKTCVAAQKELHRLLGLYQKPKTGPAAQETAGQAAAELEAVRQYLLPLGLADESTPTAELARLAVAKILNHG